jgi:hypothetical protein
LEQRADRTLSAEENAEEAHRRARLDSFDEGPESAAQKSLAVLNDKERIARSRRLRLTPKDSTELRFLRMLYSKTPDRKGNSDELRFLDEMYFPLRDEPLADDGNLYPPNSRLREIEEEFVAVPKYCYPPHARMPPLKEEDVLYVDSKGFRWSNKLLG